MAWSCGNTSNVKGVDISSDQGTAPGTTNWWQTIRSQNGVQFGIIKATEGISYVNPYAQSAWTACNAVKKSHQLVVHRFMALCDGWRVLLSPLHFW
ncbi:MAG: hypothetical protein C7B43_19680 [Sulfobacillus benefaciens]|uniref:Uncharacterized protein n=1 Tax=Sulfobacillus benefaciens TaxID=453960 RepID=A0A2T2WP44_9FIRM|nr:MAG: hypothetical protein C7B43_19680 [Sulfobacillus benefaciens]